MSKYYLNTPSEIAAALRGIVADLEAMPDVSLPNLAVSLDIQVCQHSGTPAERMEAVDVLASALLNAAGQTKQLRSGNWQHGNPFDTRRRNGIDVGVYSAVPAPVKAVA